MKIPYIFSRTWLNKEKLDLDLVHLLYLNDPYSLLLKVWPSEEQQLHMSLVKNIESQVPLWNHWLRIYMLVRFWGHPSALWERLIYYIMLFPKVVNQKIIIFNLNGSCLACDAMVCK